MHSIMSPTICIHPPKYNSAGRERCIKKNSSFTLKIDRVLKTNSRIYYCPTRITRRRKKLW